MSFIYRFMWVVMVVVSSATVVAASPLEGTKWRVEITPEGATIPHHIDRCTFQDGKFSSVIFERRGFTSVPFTAAEKAGGTVAVEMQQTSEAAGDLTWQAEVQGDALKGTLVWKQADGKAVTHALVGSPAVEEAPVPEAAAPAKKAKGMFGCTLVR